MKSQLADAIPTIRKRITRSSSRGINEQNTKATLIETLLRVE